MCCGWGGAHVSVCGCMCMCMHTEGQELFSLMKAIPKGVFLNEARAGRNKPLRVPLDDAMTTKGWDLFKLGSHFCCCYLFSPALRFQSNLSLSLLFPRNFRRKDKMESYDHCPYSPSAGASTSGSRMQLRAWG